MWIFMIRIIKSGYETDDRSQYRGLTQNKLTKMRNKGINVKVLVEKKVDLNNEIWINVFIKKKIQKFTFVAHDILGWLHESNNFSTLLNFPTMLTF